MKLNIGCGRDYRKGWVNIDQSNDVKTDICMDIRTSKFGESGSSSTIHISGVLEQIAENEHLIHVMNECHRVLMPGAIMTVVVPNANYAIAHRDPMDIRKFTPDTFSYFLKTAREWELYGSVYGFEGWSGIRIKENDRHILMITMQK